MKLNIGAGNVRLRAGYINLDLNPNHGPDVVAKVPPLPFADQSLEAVYTSHFLEHLTPDEAIATMAEIFRVMQPGSVLEAVVPYALSHGAFQDPTHRSQWVPESFLYYTDYFAYLDYGLETRFRLRSLNLADEQVFAELGRPV